MAHDERPEMRPTRIVQDLAPIFGISERTLWERMMAGQVLGVNYRNGKWLWEFGDGRPGFQGPVPDKVQEYLVPRGTRAVALELLPGAVSGLVFQGSLTEWRGIFTVEARAATSGRIVASHVDAMGSVRAEDLPDY
jgi:hypothetical protein